MNRISVIDIGTNSVKFSIGSSGAHGLVIEQEDSEITRLGKGVDSTQTLGVDSMQRTFDVIRRFTGLSHDANVDGVVAVGSSALRDASNGHEFVSRVKDELGVDVEIISGHREAELAFRAATTDPALNLTGRVLVFDVGGGSTEIITGVGGEVINSHSLDVGAVRLTERFSMQYPVSMEKLAEARSFVREEIARFPVHESSSSCVAIGGTAVTISNVINATREQPVIQHRIAYGILESTADAIYNNDIDEIKAIPGMDPGRADVIGAGLLIITGLCRAFRVQEFYVSTRGIRFGILAERLLL